jgi:hypothetical protein
MPNADFLGLIQSLKASGEAGLGQLNALTARMNRDGVQRNRATAEKSLRLLEVLAQKTRGNLDAEEAEALTNAVSSLKKLLEETPIDIIPLGMAEA